MYGRRVTHLQLESESESGGIAGNRVPSRIVMYCRTTDKFNDIRNMFRITSKIERILF